jgi:hypothetical protein
MTPEISALDKLLDLGVVGILVLCAVFVLLLLDKILPYFKRNGSSYTPNGRSGELSPAEWELRISKVVASTMEPVMAQQTAILHELAEEQRRSVEILRELQWSERQRRGSGGLDSLVGRSPNPR